jgi:hypothetical protein
MKISALSTRAKTGVERLKEQRTRDFELLDSLSAQVKHDANYPPIIDGFLRTRAGAFDTERFRRPVVDKIGAYYRFDALANASLLPDPLSSSWQPRSCVLVPGPAAWRGCVADRGGSP